MGTKETTEIKFIYNSGKLRDREALGYAKSMQHYSINDYDVQQNKFTERQLGELADRLEVKIEDLVDESSEEYTDFLKNADMDPHDKLEVLKQNPNLLRTPILESSKGSSFLKSAKSMIKEDMEFKLLKETIETII
jgi:arsenate reductase